MNALAMTDPTDDIIERLQAMLSSEDLPPRATAQGERLLERLTSPVRVVLFGFPGAGKANLLNALVGAEVTDAARQATMEFRYGDAARAEITLADGSLLKADGPYDAAAHPDAMFVTVEMPLPILKKISVIDVVADPAPEEQNAAVLWAVPRTDIAVWCSTTFTDDELMIWDNVPESMMDHAFLVLTGQNEGAGDKILQARAQHLRDELAGEFLDVFALTGLRSGDADDDPTAALTRGILRHSEHGRRADADGALLFLTAHSPAPEKPTAIEEPRPAQVAEAAQAPDATPEPTSAAHRALFSAAYAYIRNRGNQLLQSIRQSDDIDGRSIVDYCGETVSHLSDLIGSDDDPTAPELVALADTLVEAEELFVLLELENGTGPSIDAVSLLLQLRREFETRLAV